MIYEKKDQITKSLYSGIIKGSPPHVSGARYIFFSIVLLHGNENAFGQLFAKQLGFAYQKFMLVNDILHCYSSAPKHDDHFCSHFLSLATQPFMGLKTILL